MSTVAISQQSSQAITSKKIAKTKQQDLHPFKAKLLKGNGVIYELANELICTVEFIEDGYVIENEELNMFVWGGTREEAEEEFANYFDSHYQATINANDKELTADGKRFKKFFFNLVKAIYKYEAKKNK